MAPLAPIGKAMASAFLSSILPDPKDVLKVLICIILLPILVLLFSGPLVVHQRVPMVPPETAQMYFDAAESVSKATEAPCFDGVQVPWEPLLAIDAVRYEQDFSNADPDKAKELAWMFVEENGECTHCTGKGENRTCTTYPTYELLTLDEVVSELNLDIDEVQKYLKYDIAFLLPSTDLPIDFIPNEGRWTWPVPGYFTITSPFGSRLHPVLNRIIHHNGIDIGAPYNVAVVAAQNGVVSSCGYMGSAGNAILLQHDHNITTKYFHLNSILVRSGQLVQTGEIIGFVGSTGRSTGPHLHFEIVQGAKLIDPISLYDKGFNN